MTYDPGCFLGKWQYTRRELERLRMSKKKIVVSFMFCFLLAASVFFWKYDVKAAGPYTLQINKGTNVVTVYRSNGTPERAFICSTGTDTPIGTFNTSQKLRWHTLMGPSYGQYCTRIVNGVLFHSVWYYRNGDYASQSYREFNKLGTTCSHGCVRLTVADAKWIYDNCPIGTTVKIIYGSSANDPLGKPAAIKVPDRREGWDPTDPHPSNPYRNAMPSINTSGASTTLTYGSNFNPLAGISAKDSLGNDISSRISYAGTVNTWKLGSYRLTYRVTDSLGRTAYADVVYTVADTGPASINGVRTYLQKEYKSKIDLRKNVTASNATGANLTKKIKTRIIFPGYKKEKGYSKNTLTLARLGTYKINYYVTNPNNGMVTKVTCRVKVKDTKKPKLSGIPSKKTVEYKTTASLLSGVKAKLVSGKNMLSKVAVKIKRPGEKTYIKLSARKMKKFTFSKTGNYWVRYSVANPYNKKAVTEKVSVIRSKDTKKPVISGINGPITIGYGSTLNLKSGITAKLVSGKSMTSKIVMKVKTPGTTKYVKVNGTAYKKYKFDKVGTYMVEYSVANPNNTKAVALKKKKIIVKDTAKPVISGVSESGREAKVGDRMDLREGITAAMVSGTDLTADIAVKITAPDGTTPEYFQGEYTFEQMGIYTVEYSVVNPKNKDAVAVVSMKVVVSEAENPPVDPQPSEGEEQPTEPILPDNGEQPEAQEPMAGSQEPAGVQEPAESQEPAEVQETAESQESAGVQEAAENQPTEPEMPESKEAPEA